VKTYAEDVRTRKFPGREHVYGMRTGRVDAPGAVTKKPKISGN